MAIKRKFNPRASLEAARAGELTGPALQRAIKTAEEFGNEDVAAQLRVLVIQPSSFAGDAAPAEVRERVAQGMAALRELGKAVGGMTQMLRRHGVVETINRNAKRPDMTEHFDCLRGAGLERLTAEAIVLEYPDLFSEQAVGLSKKRLGR
jgi:hypothetical protein